MGEKSTRRKTTGVVRVVFGSKRPADGETKSGTKINSTFVIPVRSAINRFSSSRHSSQESSSRCETAVRVGSTGRICASDTTPDGERGARSRARASCVVPRQSRRRICRTGATTNPRKVCTKLGSSTAMNDRGTHQTLTRYVRRAGGVDMCLCERVWENTASQTCASSSETRRVSTGRTPTCYVLRSLKKKNRDV